jgi:di/tricarboxylate transporter
MVAASAAFATPFGYQTNVVVYQMGGYNYLDFLKIGLPLNLITWAAAVFAIQAYFPF